MSAHQKPVRATFEGEPIEAPAGASIAAALINSDRIAWRSTRDGAKRGLFCGIGVCFDCLVEVDGESGQRACMIPLQEGMRVCAAKGPSTEHEGNSEGTGSVTDTDTDTGEDAHEGTGATPPERPTSQLPGSPQPASQHSSDEGAAK